MMNLAPSDSTCSPAAARTSVALTTAPRRLAVAIACRPATPAPITKTFAGRTVPAAALHDESGAERLDLLTGRGPHTRRAHHRPEALGRSDRLQAGHARAHHEDVRGPHRAGGGHHHRHGAVEGIGRLEHRLVAREI